MAVEVADWNHEPVLIAKTQTRKGERGCFGNAHVFDTTNAVDDSSAVHDIFSNRISVRLFQETTIFANLSVERSGKTALFVKLIVFCGAIQNVMKFVDRPGLPDAVVD